MALLYLILAGYFIFIAGAIFSFFKILADSKNEFLKLISKNRYFLLILIALMTFIFSLPFFDRSMTSESLTYESQAKCILDRIFFRTPELDEYCTFWLFSGEHELTYPIAISVIRTIFPQQHYDLGMRGLVFFLNLLSSFFIFLFVSRRKGPYIALFASFLLFVMPLFLFYVFNFYSENLYLMIFFSIIFITDYVKLKNLHFLAFILSILVLTRVETILLLPVIIAYIISRRNIDLNLKNKPTRKVILLTLAVFLLFGFFFYLTSEIRVMGQTEVSISAFALFPLYLSTSLAFLLFSHKKKRLYALSGVIFFLAILIYSLSRTQVLGHYSLSGYLDRLFAYWLPELLHYLFYFKPFVTYSLIAFFVLFMIRLVFQVIGKSGKEEKTTLGEITFFLLFSFCILNILSYLETSNFDGRFLHVFFYFLVIPIALSFPAFKYRGLRKASSVLMVVLVFIILSLIFSFSQHNQRYFDSIGFFDDVALRMTEDLPVVFMHITNIELIFLRTERDFVLFRIHDLGEQSYLKERLNSYERFYFLSFCNETELYGHFAEMRENLEEIIDAFDKKTEVYRNEAFVLNVIENHNPVPFPE